MITVDQVLHTEFVVVRAVWPVAKARQFLSRTKATFVVVQREEGAAEWLYLLPREAFLARLKDQPADLDLTRALQLHESGAAPVVEPTAATTDIAQPAVVRDAAGTILGFVFPPSTHRAVPPSLPTSTFEAYPALTAPEQVAPQQPIPIGVGFRATADPTLAQGRQKLVFREVMPTDSCTVLLEGDGITLDQYQVTLPLRMDASVAVTGTPTRATGTVSIRADYYFRGVPIGQAERIISVGAAPAEPASLPSVLQSPDLAGAVDLVVTVRRTSDGRLAWSAISSNPALPPVTNCASGDLFSMDDARRFAAEVMAEAEKSNVTTFDVLEGMGAEIAALVPQAIWDLQTALAAGRSEPLLVLLKTDEPFIPWELALLPQPLDPQASLFWAAQTYFGRWVDRSTVCVMPPHTATITCISAVASHYGDIRSGQAALPNAEKERDILVEQWHATALLAERKDLDTILIGERTPGHLLHFAVHGENIPSANEQHLILGDGTNLSPRELAPRVIAGQPPRFSLVFLNACQVATAGTSLGQTAGFPGILLNSGTFGFLAPLWKVNDGEALQFATTFYTQTLKDRTPVGQVLHSYRATYDRSASTTRLAYVWYGHPALRLQFEPKGAPV